MMDLSKTLQEDIRINQINLKAAIQNHQALVVKLRVGNLTDPSEVKLKLAGIQKHILSLGEAQKVLLARVKKELSANSNSWNKHTPNAELRVYPPSANYLDATAKKFNSAAYQKRTIKEEPDDGPDEGSRKRNRDGGGTDQPSKRVKTILHASSRPASPLHSSQNYDQGTVPTSSDDSQESLTIDTSSEPSKVDFLSAVGLVNREQLMLSKSNHCVRRRRRHAGHHSQYTSQSHWDLTVRRHRSRCEQDKDQQQLQPPQPHAPAPRENTAVTSSPAIVEVRREPETTSNSSSGSNSPALSQEVAPKATPTPTNNNNNKSTAVVSLSDSTSPDKIVCTVCRKRGILSVCDICSTAFHWFCLEKGKLCPVCQVSQVGENTPTVFRPRLQQSVGGGSEAAAVNKVMGQSRDKPPNHVTSDEVFTRYYKRVPPANSDANHYAERLKVKKSLEARNECLKRELGGLKKKATELSAALVSQTENIKKLTAGEEKTNEKIKKILDIINFFKTAPS